jgi:hypothetical protein
MNLLGRAEEVESACSEVAAGLAIRLACVRQSEATSTQGTVMRRSVSDWYVLPTLTSDPRLTNRFVIGRSVDPSFSYTEST